MTRSVVTGGNLGIGAAVVDALVRRNADVCILARSVAPGRGSGGRAFGIPTDIRNPDEVRASATSVREHFNGADLDLLILCAGVGDERDLASSSDEMVAAIIETNVLGTIYCARELTPFLCSGGTLVIVSSIAGIRGFPRWSVYCASKFALEGFAASLRHELRPRRIRVTVVRPGSVDTDSYAHLPTEAKVDFIDPATVGDLIVASVFVEPNAAVEEIFINNTVGDL